MNGRAREKEKKNSQRNELGLRTFIVALFCLFWGDLRRSFVSTPTWEMESRWLLSLPSDLELVSDVTAFLMDRLGVPGEGSERLQTLLIKGPTMARGRVIMACAALACTLVSMKSAFTPSLPGNMGMATAGMGAQRTLTQRNADGSMLKPFGPVVTYAKALMDAAREKGEDVPVTEDVLKIKDKFKEEEWLDKLVTVQNDPFLTEVQKANNIVDLLKPLKSTVMPKFIVFLAKKNRLNGIKVIMFEYVQSMYYLQSITPVRVTSAQRLTDDQLAKIKEKMKSKCGTKDVKLVAEVDPNLIGGLTLEWGYTDPVQLYAPTHGVDLSLKNILNKRALQKGVVPCVKLNGFTLPATEPAHLLIRDGDVLALEWKDVSKMSTAKSSGAGAGYARGDLAARRRLEGAARRAGLENLPEVLPGDEPQLFDDQLLGGWPKAVAAWTAARQLPRAKVAKASQVVLVKVRLREVQKGGSSWLDNIDEHWPPLEAFPASRSTQHGATPGRGRGKSKTYRRRDVSGLPVQILHPSKVMHGKPKAYWIDVFRVWEREIPKPDFAIHHAAKAVRLLPKVNFTGMPTKHPVLWNLLRRTKVGNSMTHEVCMVMGAPESRINAAVALQKPIPALKVDIVPLLQIKVRDAVDAMSNKELPENCAWCSSCSGRLGPELDEAIDIEDGPASDQRQDIPKIIELLCSEEVAVTAAAVLEEGQLPQSSDGEGLRPLESGQLLRALRDQVVIYWDSFELSEIASCFWNLAKAKLIHEPLQAAASHMVVQKAPRWQPKRFDPEVWQILCSLAKVGREDPVLLKSLARLALRHNLGIMTNWAVCVTAWYAQLESPQDGLGDFRQRLQMELNLREISAKEVAQSWQDMDEFWLRRRIAQRPLFIAPRPVKLLQRRSAEADLKQAAEVGKLLAKPNWRKAWLGGYLDRVDEDEADAPDDLEDFRLFDASEDLGD
eukprot:s946_g3.t1